MLDPNRYEIYWFDILTRGKTNWKNYSKEFVNWKNKKVKGGYFLKKNAPSLFKMTQGLFEVTPAEQLDLIIKEIRPNVIHSFEMHHCTIPLLKTMNNHKAIPWIYSCWGSDMYYFQHFKKIRKSIAKVLNRIDYLITDCERDKKLAYSLGFKGQYLGLFAGGLGLSCNQITAHEKIKNDQNKILVKGYEHKFGKALNVIKALEKIGAFKKYEVIIFGAHKAVVDYVEHRYPLAKVYTRHELGRKELLDLMFSCDYYIGNSISDGMPNTLLEAMMAQCTVMQSNPGGVTSEIISNKINGYIIKYPENIVEIAKAVSEMLDAPIFDDLVYKSNQELAISKLCINKNKERVNHIYKNVRQDT